MLKLRTIGINDYRVLESRQRIGRIRFAEERLPRWLWNVTVHLPGGLPMGSAKDLDTRPRRSSKRPEASRARLSRRPVRPLDQGQTALCASAQAPTLSKPHISRLWQQKAFLRSVKNTGLLRRF
jgi:hypothetical protein